MKTTALTVSLALTALLSAQDPGAEPAERGAQLLTRQLRAAAALPAGGFEMEWKWPRVLRGSATVQRSGGDIVEKAAGQWRDDVLAVRLDRPGVEVVQAGRLMVLREKQDRWRLAAPASSRHTAFLPDPQKLMLALAAVDPQVTQREIVDVQGRATERISATLDGDQLGELVFAGVVQNPSPLGAAMRRRNGRGGKPPEVAPLDVVVDVDVASRGVRRVLLRTIVEQVDIRAMMQRQRGQLVGRGGEQPEEEPQEESQEAPAQPLRYEHGLPVRE
ncbi:MAG: hypothetical protein KAI24_23870, partial [Planctomycetes bacterium]|nr:hypothetical protein [Planctomycetota bacterium]